MLLRSPTVNYDRDSMADRGDTDLQELALAILENPDHTRVFAALKPYLDAPTFKELGYMTELCPVHCCDAEICRDDQDDCEAGRADA